MAGMHVLTHMHAGAVDVKAVMPEPAPASTCTCARRQTVGFARRTAAALPSLLHTRTRLAAVSVLKVAVLLGACLHTHTGGGACGSTIASSQPKKRSDSSSTPWPVTPPRAPGTPRVTEKVCSVFLDADATFYAQWRGVCNATLTAAACKWQQQHSVATKMLAAVRAADAALARNPFLGPKISVHVAGSHIHESNCSSLGVLAQERLPLLDVNDAQEALDVYARWLARDVRYFDGGPIAYPRAEGQPPSHAVCANILFTHRDLAGTLGLANVGAACSHVFPTAAGGIGSHRLARNVMVVSSNGGRGHVLTDDQLGDLVVSQAV